MDALYLKQCILNKELPPSSVIMTGDETFLHIYVQQLYATFPVRVLTSVQEYIRLNSLKFKVNSKPEVYLIFNDMDYVKDNSTWGINLENAILVYDKLDKQSKFFKAFENRIVVFPPMDENLLKGIARYNLDISEESIDTLIKETGKNYFRLKTEITRLKSFPADQQQKMFNIFLQDGTLCYEEYYDGFELSNEVMNRNKYNSLKTLSRIERNNGLPQLALIYTSIRNQLLVQGGSKNAEAVGMNPKMYYVLSKRRNYSVEELCKMLILIVDLIRSIREGTIDNWEALNLFVLTVV